jgi:pimeloyl-ACP methyl ester carboxylesterase
MNFALRKSDISKTAISHLLLLLVISCCCTGCFRRFVQTDKQLKTYFKDKPVQPTYFTIQNDSVRLYCATAGADSLPPLLVIHGAPGAWYGSRNLLVDTLITQRFHVIAVDRPGYNKSKFREKKKAVTSIALQSTAIYEAMRLNRSNKKGVVMGSSYGGPIAARVAINHPESFYHVIMLAAAIDPEHEKFWWFNKWVHHGPLKWMLPRFFRTATDEKYAHISELRQMLPVWSRLTVPVTAVQGDADNTVMPINLEFARKVLQGQQAQFIVVPGGGHLIRFQHPELVRQLLLNNPQQPSATGIK